VVLQGNLRGATSYGGTLPFSETLSISAYFQNHGKFPPCLRLFRLLSEASTKWITLSRNSGRDQDQGQFSADRGSCDCLGNRQYRIRRVLRFRLYISYGTSPRATVRSTVAIKHLWGYFERLWLETASSRNTRV
jgi:hypothetical protein